MAQISDECIVREYVLFVKGFILVHNDLVLRTSPAYKMGGGGGVGDKSNNNLTIMYD